jgi:hypothetical protein
VAVETYKDAPKMGDVYEQSVKAKNLVFYSNIKSLLMNAEPSSELNLSKIFVDQSTMSKQFEVICESIKISSRQQISYLNSDYLKNLTKIDLSCNQLNDQFLIGFFESIFFECSNLKELNLSDNLISSKSLKSLVDMINANKSTGNTFSKALEVFYLSGNDLGISLPSIDLAFILSNLLVLFQSLRTLHLSDCRISLNECIQENENDTSSLHKLLISIKSITYSFILVMIVNNSYSANLICFFLDSKLNELNVSYNPLGYRILSNLVEFMPECQIESLCLADCSKTILNEEAESYSKIELKRNDLANSLLKFVSFNIRSLSIRCLDLGKQQTDDLIK